MIRRRRLVNPMRINYANGAFYRGETNAAGLPHGWGETLYKNNTVIAGKWIDGVMSGKGVYMSTEMTYKGDWKNDVPHGVGSMNTHNTYYIGHWIDGQQREDGLVIRAK